MKHSFRRRLFAAMLLASLLPLLLCTVLMVQITRLRMQNKAREDLGEQSAILCQSLSSLRDAMVQSADKLRDDDSVIHALGSGTGSRFQINSLLFTATDSWRTIGVFDLYDSTGVCRYSTRGTVSQNLPTDWGVLYGAAQAEGKPVYYAAENPADMTSPLLLGGVALRAEDGCGGFLVMRVYAAGFHALLDGKYVQSDVLVLSKFFRPIYGSQTSLTQVLAPQLRQTLLAGEAPADSNYVYKIVNHPETGLNLVLRQPQMFTSRTVWLLYTAGILCVLACVCVSALVSLPISRQIAAPLERLMTGFRRVQQDNLEIQIPVDRQDEFGELAEQFNQTVRALNTNRAELLRNQQELNQAQIRMMQAQLNPHFLCNTLDTMKWISKINKVPQVAMMATNLADILGPAMRNILAPVPVTRPSALNSMAALTTALAKPVMGTSDPAPAFAASFWYQPSVVSTAESKIKVQLVRVPAASASAPCRRNSCRSPSPSRQMPPPTQNAQRQSARSGECGPAFCTRRAYSCAVIFIFPRPLLRIVCPGRRVLILFL